MAKKEGKILVFRGQSFDRGMMQYWWDDEEKQIRTFSDKLNEQIFTAGELPVSYRVLNHWEAKGILPESVNSGGEWRKFNYIERVWLAVALHLREFGMPLEKIAKVRKGVLSYESKKQRYLRFEYYVVRAWFSPEDPYVIVLPDGSADIGTSAEIETSKLNGAHHNVLLISLKNVLEGLGHEVVSIKPLGSINSDEEQLLSHIRLGNNDEILTKMSDGSISEIHTSKKYDAGVSLSDIQKGIEKNTEFAEVVTKFQAGISETTKVTKKYRTNSQSHHKTGAIKK